MGARGGSNWVDRGESLEPVLARMLSRAVGCAPDDPALHDHALTIQGMVEADSTEVHVASYLRTVSEAFGKEEIEPMLRRTVAVALWHIVKVAQVRDQAAREIASLRKALPPEPPLAEQLRDAILGAPGGESVRVDGQGRS